MGVIVNAKEDINDTTTPCINTTIFPKGEIDAKAIEISVHLESSHVGDTIASIQGKEKSFGKLGMNVFDFSKLAEESCSCAHLVKGIRNKKVILCIGVGKKATHSKKEKSTSSKKEKIKDSKAMRAIQGRKVAKSTISILTREGATSSLIILGQKLSGLKDQLPQVEGTKERHRRQ